MANYQIKLVLRPELVLRSSCYPNSKFTHYYKETCVFMVLHTVCLCRSFVFINFILTTYCLCHFIMFVIMIILIVLCSCSCNSVRMSSKSIKGNLLTYCVILLHLMQNRAYICCLPVNRHRNYRILF